MRMSIRLRTILVLDAFVVSLALVFGWIAQDVAGRMVEERCVKETVGSASGFLKASHLPKTDTMMIHLRDLFSAEWIAWRDQPPGVVGSSLPEQSTKEFLRQVAPTGRVGVTKLAGRLYRMDSAAMPMEEPATGRPTPGRLYILAPDTQFQQARRQAQAKVAKVIWPAAGVSTLLAIWLSVSMTRPIRKLAGRMDQLAANDGDKSDPGPTVETQEPKEIRALSSSFYRLLDRLAAARRRMVQSEQLATLGRICLSVAHELRNPLSGIKMNIRVLQDRPDLKDDPGVKAVLREIDRMGLYLNELMSLAPGSDQTQAPPSPTPVKLSELAESVLTILAGRCRHANVLVHRDYPADEPAVLAQANPIRQAMMNLMTNAIEAMPSGGTMTIGIRAHDDLRFLVSDTGQGVQAAGQDVFEAFVSHKPNGVGLGLYICKQIIAAHAGRIGYDTGPAGAAFWFDLPTGRGCENSPEPTGDCVAEVAT